MADSEGYPVAISNEEWRKRLAPAEYAVLREGATERPFSGEYEDFAEPGVYECRACGADLYSADTKFDAHCGWPAFWDQVKPGAIEFVEDTSMGMKRTEIRCAQCGSHLGHVFYGEGFGHPTDARHCVNSLSIRHRGV